ncbi:FAD-binding oxidoreductase [Methylobacterium sp. J-070]|uniref:FAD-binding oxidoreductase n=1 Tax=Methylobacterium sp. J-070 TaxID=2836650 RepID=UPI001FB95DEE|nr:FAD-binding oxidoreductase [Methylobacterium sp. J-070]MCJ2053870.1 FAD-binding oxidoreductase [Methylobacterium sp. J-070]
MMLSGWGNYPRVDCTVTRPRDVAELMGAIGRNPTLIARGAGRSYGDAALNRAATLVTTRLNRIAAFDPASGVVSCEAGTTLDELIEVFLPRGWFPWVTPGTRFVTVGGAIASDVHGKNHHLDGTFGRHLLSIDLALADGSVVRCSDNENPDLFAATQGGMGLTGVILRATFRLRPVETDLVVQHTTRTRDLAQTFSALEDASDATYSVAWIDCLARGANLGRGVVYRGEHAALGDLPPAREGRAYEDAPRRSRTLPLSPPSFALNRYSMGALNAAYYGRAKAGRNLVSYQTFFYPLDALLHWNRIYGRQGFVQHQCVLPLVSCDEALRELLTMIAARGTGSFLAVLKLCGEAARGPLSFPMRGYTLALDFQANAGNFSLLTELDEVVAAHGGRFYLAKDARGGARLLRDGYPRLEEFSRTRDRYDPRRRFRSVQSERLGL